MEAHHRASPHSLPEVCTALVSWHTLQVRSAQPKDWTYSVVGYHFGLLSRKPGFESWYVRHTLTRT